MQIPYFQEKISEKASEILQEKLGVETQIGRVDFELFNKLILKDIYLADQSGDTLFQAKRLAVGFEFSPLFKGELRFRSAQLFSFQLNLNKENSSSPLNLQFVIDAFASKDTTKKNTKIDIQIQKLNIRRGNITFRVKSDQKTPGKFNPKDIFIKDLSAKIQVDKLTNDQLIAKVSHFSFSEQSGLSVRRLSFDISGSNRRAKMEHLELQLPHTVLQLKDISADYSEVFSPEDYVPKTIFNVQIDPSDIYPQDISPLVPVLANYDDKITIGGHLSGSLNHITLDNFLLQDGNKLMLQGNAEVKDMTDQQNMYIHGTIQESFISTQGIQQTANNFSKSPVVLPLQVTQLGNIRFEGEVSGFLHHLSAYGIFNTDVGTLRTDINLGREENFFINGKITSSGVNLKKLMNDEKYGNTSFDILVDATQDKDKQFSGKINARVGRFEYNGYSYENLGFNGSFGHSSFEGEFKADSPDGQLSAKGLFALKGKDSEFNFSAEAKHIKLDKLKLSQKYKDSDLSFNVDANFTGDNIDNLIGRVHLTDMKFSTEKGGYYLDTLDVSSNQVGIEKVLSIHSDIANGEVRGAFSFLGIVPAIKQTVSLYLPTLVPPPTKIIPEANNNFSINLTIEDMEEMSYIMSLPFTLHNKTRIVGQYNNIYDKFKFEIYSPRISFGKTILESGTVLLENPGKEISLQVSGINTKKSKQNNGDPMKRTLSASLSAANDVINTTFSWDNNQVKKYAGQLAFNTLLSKKDSGSSLKADINMLETNLTFNDSTWTVHPAMIELDKEKVTVRNLRIDHADQFVLIDGSASKNVEDNLRVDLNKVDLEYLFKSLDIKALEFGGIASGYVNAQDLFKTRKLSTNLNVTNFAFNSTTFGDLTLEGLWDEEQQGILMRGNIYKNDTTKVDVDGIIYPVKEELSINFDAQNADASFLRKYMNNVAKNVSGKLFGKLRLFGDLNNPTVEGDVFVKNGGFGIEFLNTYYTFSDSVKCLPGEILIKDVNFYDKNGWAALANGSVRHHLFDDFSYSANFLFDNFLVFNATEKLNPAFFGTVYGTGSASIRGTEKVINIDVSMKNTKNSKMSLNLMEESDISTYDFIHFLNHEKDTTSVVEKFFTIAENKPIYLTSNSGSDIRFNLNLDATPEATIDLIMDPLTGDKIRTYGSGHLQVQYGTRIPLKISGKYTIEHGKYNFSLQQVIFRDFDIKEGSSVSFQGNPYNANLNIDAIYTVNANLRDLNPDLVGYAGRNSVPVNCVLDINGSMEHPDIKFNIELPESEYLERQIKNYINTEDMMNRQMVYLLVLKQFYTPPEYASNNMGSSHNELSNLATSTLSSSLSSLLGSISDKFQLGTRIRTGDMSTQTTDQWTGTEVELILSSQLLDNRLIINGNFGYRDNAAINSSDNQLTPFIGDFDLEYKLTEGGGVRLKAYNHYNYKYYYDNRSKTTQGLGIMFRKDFERIDELFGKKRVNIPPLRNDSTSSYLSPGKKDFIFFKK